MNRCRGERLIGKWVGGNINGQMRGVDGWYMRVDGHAAGGRLGD